jgi:hypothetical protein
VSDIGWIDAALSSARPRAVGALLRHFRDLAGSNPFSRTLGPTTPQITSTSQPAQSSGSNKATTGNPFSTVLAKGNGSAAPFTAHGSPGDPHKPSSSLVTNPFSRALAPTQPSAPPTGNSPGRPANPSFDSTNFNATHATVSNKVYQPIKQTDVNQYSGSTSDARKALASKEGPDACYAAVKTMIARQAGNDKAMIDQFYPGGGGALPGNVRIGSNTTLSSIAHSPSGPALMIIHAVNKRDGSGREDHYMLGTHVAGPDGQKIITANDPWTGRQVQIKATTGKIMDDSHPLHSFLADEFRTVQVD